jgi:hypothetical protein
MIRNKEGRPIRLVAVGVIAMKLLTWSKRSAADAGCARRLD